MEICEMKDRCPGILECTKEHGIFEEGKHYLIYDKPIGRPLFINNKEIEVFAVEVIALEEILPLGYDLNLTSVYLSSSDISENFKFVHIRPYTECIARVGTSCFTMGNKYTIKNRLEHKKPQLDFLVQTDNEDIVLEIHSAFQIFRGITFSDGDMKRKAVCIEELSIFHCKEGKSAVCILFEKGKTYTIKEGVRDISFDCGQDGLTTLPKKIFNLYFTLETV